MLKLTREQILDFWFVDVQEGTIRKKILTYKGIIPGEIIKNSDVDGYFRAAKRINSKYHVWYAHHLIWVVAGNNWPISKKQHIHHLNGIITDNRIINLKLMIIRDHINRHTNRNNDMRNITWHEPTQTWQIRFTISGKLKSFGYYADLIEAKAIRDQIAINLHEKGLY